MDEERRSQSPEGGDRQPLREGEPDGPRDPLRPHVPDAPRDPLRQHEADGPRAPHAEEPLTDEPSETGARPAEEAATGGSPEDPAASGTPEAPAEPATGWYYLKGSQTYGPVPEDSIRAWLESGFLQANDLLWRAGLAEWTPAWQALGPASGAVGPPEPPGLEGRRAGPWAAPTAAPLDAAGRPLAYAGFLLRAGAAMIDWVLLSLVMFLVFRPEIPAATSLEEMRQAVEAMQANRTMIAFSVVLPWLYFAALESSPWQATLGKKAFRLRVIHVNGSRIGPIRATFRHLAKVFLMDLTLFLSFLFAAFTPRRQALHDFAAGTTVIRD